MSSQRAAVARRDSFVQGCQHYSHVSLFFFLQERCTYTTLRRHLRDPIVIKEAQLIRIASWHHPAISHSNAPAFLVIRHPSISTTLPTIFWRGHLPDHTTRTRRVQINSGKVCTYIKNHHSMQYMLINLLCLTWCSIVSVSRIVIRYH